MSIPTFLNELLINEYGKDITNKILEGLTLNRPTTFRVNTLKSTVEEIQEKLDVLDIKYRKFESIDNAFILEEEYKVQDLNIYKDGKIYVQSLSSMLPPIILKPKEKENILDMCAAPGRKNNSDCSNF